MPEVVFTRRNGWLPSVVRADGALHLQVIGGADALHDPRTFWIPISQVHLDALRKDFRRHLLLYSALEPLCRAAGISADIDQEAASALLDPLLLGPGEEIDGVLAGTTWSPFTLIAHGGDPELLEAGRVFEALGSATEQADWGRVDTYRAQRSRAQRGVVLGELDTAVLTYTGQLLYRATVPGRHPDRVNAQDLPAVLEVVRAAERAAAGLTIARDPRHGLYGMVKEDWNRMSETIAATLRTQRPDLCADTIASLAFLLCSEESKRARCGPFDNDGADLNQTRAPQPLVFSDDNDDEETWRPGDSLPAVEAFWRYVAERTDAGIKGVSVEFPEAGDGIQAHFSLDLLARYRVLTPGDDTTDPEYHSEYALLDGMADYRALVRAALAGGFPQLDNLATWLPDTAAFEQAWRRRKADREASSG